MFRPLAIFLTFLFSETARACHPLCTYECSDPVCTASCAPICLPYRCQVCYNVSHGAPDCPRPIFGSGCRVYCPPDQCESDECPTCEIICNVDLFCATNDPTCFVECEELQCGWKCAKPSPAECPPPTCELQCDQPACPTSIASFSFCPLASLLLFTTALTTINYI
jgi:hypothetical protein